jgi:opacity protein-like surface antigen
MAVLSRATVVAAVVMLSLVTAPAASAQEPGTIPVPLGEISAGYVFMHDFTNLGPVKGVDFPAGWYFSGAINPTTWFGVVGEVTGSYKSNLNIEYFGIRSVSDAQVYTLMGGPRFFKKVGRVVPFAQVLTGVAHMRASGRFSGFDIPGGDFDFKERATEFALQPGGGVTVYLTNHVGLRLAGDYRSVIDFHEEENDYTNEFRVAAGFTMHWGGR